jgi:hypothetical protein
MTTSDIRDLLYEARCFTCYGPASVADLIKMALTIRVATAAGVTQPLDAASLFYMANCWGCGNANPPTPPGSVGNDALQYCCVCP